MRQAVGAIVYHGEQFLLVHKTKINTKNGKEAIVGEWDFVKGKVEKEDGNLEKEVLRELKEETGSECYKIMKSFDEKIEFVFPSEIQRKIGFEKQETTMFLVEFKGEEALVPIDSEISSVRLVDKSEVVALLTHEETKRYFEKHFVGVV
ncbi:dinucleoside polyphosphate hydrolase [Alkalihalobacillus alcalophilus ATCC 27647 = CGMCC 1.3604]|uniref:Dinucleoside polyphosphate hydrolase n=1 Tax=Alkalihalobacillus alcalophilus ATCC 27647 = CGMCC 1.3604 TaxID=1218173 RepID=A0A4S4K2Z3_ALKAL|nr:dinucleoside polyphosphate hydrolase [Alkalihalobacillus alcalophilus ATCC 27647 = CGMCC 1.3604]